MKNYNKLYFNEVQNFCSSNYIARRMKKYSKDCKKMFANHIYIKELISGIYNKIKDSQTSISNQLKLGKRLN